MVDDGGDGEEAAPLIHIHGAGDGGVEVGDGSGIEGLDPGVEVGPVVLDRVGLLVVPLIYVAADRVTRGPDGGLGSTK